jgi:hypothetical protein
MSANMKKATDQHRWNTDLANPATTGPACGRVGKATHGLLRHFIPRNDKQIIFLTSLQSCKAREGISSFQKKFLNPVVTGLSLKILSFNLCSSVFIRG